MIDGLYDYVWGGVRSNFNIKFVHLVDLKFYACFQEKSHVEPGRREPERD